MPLPVRSLQVRLIVFPMALLAIWLALALAGAIYVAKGRIAAEVKASLALVRALTDAGSANAKDSAAMVTEVQKHLPPTRHFLLGITESPEPAAIRDIAGHKESEWAAPNWFISLIAPASPIELVKVASAGGGAEWIYIIPNPADEIREVWQEFCFIAAICTALAVIIAGSSVWMVRNILRPIRALGDGLERLERKDFQATLEPIRFSELQKIEGQFNSLASSLKEKTSENQHLYQKLISAQDNERKQVARELHDELGPCLFGIRAEAASILQSLEPSTVDDHIAARAKAIDLLVDTIQQINRRILHTLQPAALSERGLAWALRDLIDRWQDTYPDVTWSLDFAENELDDLSQEVSLAVYRMVQEGLTNIARHSECSEAGIVITIHKNGKAEALDVLVKDNGKGFERLPSSAGGLQGMEERIHKLGGEFRVRGSLGMGVSVRASIPLS